MKVSRYVEIIEEQLQTRLGIENEKQLIVDSAESMLPQEAKLTLAGYAKQLIEYFSTGIDRELSIAHLHADLRSLGFVQLETDAWTHPEGDEVGDKILAGLLRNDVDDRAKRFRREAHAQGLRPDTLPPPEDVENVQHHEGGRITWTQRKGHRYNDPAPLVARID